MYTKLLYFTAVLLVPCHIKGQERDVSRNIPPGPVAAYHLFGKAQHNLHHLIQCYNAPAQQDYTYLTLSIVLYGAQEPLYRDTFNITKAISGTQPGGLKLPADKQNIRETYRNFISHYGVLPVGTYMQETHWLDSRYEIKAGDRQLLITDSFMKEDHPVFLQFKKYYAEQTKGKRFIQPDQVIRKFFRKRKETWRVQSAGGHRDIWIYFEDRLAGIIRLSGDDRKPEIALPSVSGPSSGKNFEGMLSASRRTNSGASENKDIRGNLNVQYNYSNQQEVYSDFRNEYYDVAGTVNMPVMGIPVTVDGYYTRQDKYRTLKSSYINVSFDKETYLRQMEEANRNFRSAYTATTVDNMMYGDYYKTLVRQLQKEKADYIATLKRTVTDTLEKAYLDKIQHRLPDTSTQEYTEQYNAFRNKYRDAAQRLEDIDHKIEKAGLLAEQLKKKKYIDSVEVFSRFRKEDIGNMDSRDYMSVLEHTFPDNKMLSRLKRLNGFNIGGFSNHVSQYTNPGQMTRGGSLSYDLDYVDVAVSLGRMDLVDFAGEKERLNAGSVQVLSRKLKHQQLGLIYYYAGSAGSAGKKDAGTGEGPGKQPADNIYTMVYRLNLPVLELSSEYAYSDHKPSGAAPATGIFGRTAFNMQAAARIWQEKIRLSGIYEYTGKDFRNRSLYYNIRGLGRYQLKLSTFWFRNAVKADVEYNVLQNVRELGTGTNRKYGFELQTISRRYPRVKISYKPFTAFNTVQDTVSNFSYTLLGNVFLAQADYQYKRKQTVMSAGLQYNRSYSELDTVQYSSSIWSFHYNVAHNRVFASMNAGRSFIASNIINPMQLLMNNSTFAMLQATYQLFPHVAVGGGWNGGWNRGAMTRYGGRVSISATHRKTGCTLYLNGAYTRYNITGQWEDIYHITSGIIIPFQFTLK